MKVQEGIVPGFTGFVDRNATIGDWRVGSFVLDGAPAPAPTPQPAPPSAPSGWMNYTIRPGDTLSVLAARTGTTVAELASRNGIANPDRIYAGNTIQVPGTGWWWALPDPPRRHPLRAGRALGHHRGGHRRAQRHRRAQPDLRRELADPPMTHESTAAGLEPGGGSLVLSLALLLWLLGKACPRFVLWFERHEGNHPNHAQEEPFVSDPRPRPLRVAGSIVGGLTGLVGSGLLTPAKATASPA